MRPALAVLLSALVCTVRGAQSGNEVDRVQRMATKPGSDPIAQAMRPTIDQFKSIGVSGLKPVGERKVRTSAPADTPPAQIATPRLRPVGERIVKTSTPADTPPTKTASTAPKTASASATKPVSGSTTISKPASTPAPAGTKKAPTATAQKTTPTTVGPSAATVPAAKPSTQTSAPVQSTPTSSAATGTTAKPSVRSSAPVQDTSKPSTLAQPVPAKTAPAQSNTVVPPQSNPAKAEIELKNHLEWLERQAADARKKAEELQKDLTAAKQQVEAEKTRLKTREEELKRDHEGRMAAERTKTKTAEDQINALKEEQARAKTDTEKLKAEHERKIREEQARAKGLEEKLKTQNEERLKEQAKLKSDAEKAKAQFEERLQEEQMKRKSAEDQLKAQSEAQSSLKTGSEAAHSKLRAEAEAKYSKLKADEEARYQRLKAEFDEQVEANKKQALLFEQAKRDRMAGIELNRAKGDAEKDSMAREIKELQAALAEEAKKAMEKPSEARMKRDIKELKVKLQGKNAEIGQAREELQNATRQLTLAEQEIETLTRDLAEAKKGLGKAQLEATATNEKWIKVKQHLAEVVAKEANNTKEIQRLRGVEQDLARQIDKLNGSLQESKISYLEQYGELEKKVDNLTKERSHMQATILKHLEELRVADQEKQSLNQQIKSSQTQIESLKTQLEAKTGEVQGMAERISQNEAVNLDLKTSGEALMKRIEDLESIKTNLTGKLASLADAKADKSKETAPTDLSAHKKLIEELDKEVADKKAALSELQNEQAALQQTIAEQTQKLQEDLRERECEIKTLMESAKAKIWKNLVLGLAEEEQSARKAMEEKIVVLERNPAEERCDPGVRIESCSDEDPLEDVCKEEVTEYFEIQPVEIDQPHTRKTDQITDEAEKRYDSIFDRFNGGVEALQQSSSTDIVSDFSLLIIGSVLASGAALAVF